MPWIDVAVLGVYFALMAAMGPLFMRRGTTTEGYFLGNRAFSGWLVGFSMFATSISSLTFLAYPADAYKTAWLRMLPNFALPVVVLMASHLFLPFFRRGNITSAYEYLEGRFGPKVRLYAACVFIFGQVVRISLILYLVSQLVEQVTGLEPWMSVLIGGVITSFYTVLGGITAVIWTDFIQAMVLWFGGVVCVIVVACYLGGPVEGIFEIVRVGIRDGKFAFAELQEDGRLVPVPWGFSLVNKTVLMMLLIGMGNWIYEYSGNQNVIQRYCASRSPRHARIAMWTCCWFSVPTWALFMFLGTALYVFYQNFPQPEAIDMLAGANEAKAEGILPFFVINRLPVGVTGLVIAAVLSAAMSSISSSINGVCAVSIVDVYRRHLVTDRDDKHYVIVAKLIGAAQGIIMIVGALILTWVETKTLQDTSTQMAAMMAGGLAALYLLGFLTVRCNGKAAFTGIACTVLFTGWMATIKLEWVNWPPMLVAIETYYVGIIGNVIMFMVGYLAGTLLFPRKEEVPNNLSLWTQDGTPLD
ncbi:MAG: sodium/solute symporter [Candidatus Hydrogenedentota bacterium]